MELLLTARSSMKSVLRNEMEANGLITGLQLLMDGLFYLLVALLSRLLTILLTLILGYITYWSIHRLDRSRDMTEVGFGYLQGKKSSRRYCFPGLVKDVVSNRKPGETPPVFPNGWFPLIESRDLRVGKSLPVTALGKEFAVFRGHDGRAYVLNAHCPHLGAHLGVGGRVYGNCLECPFHGWRFKGENGVIESIPYAEKVPEFIKTKSWPVCEKNGFLYVWFHAEDERPFWYPPDIPEVTEGLWSYRGRTQHTVNCHIQEIPENGADAAHLGHLHYDSVFSGSDLRFTNSRFWEFCKHDWKPQWEPDPEPNNHMASIYLTHVTRVFGYALPFTELTLNIKQIGPAIVHLAFNSRFGSGVFVQGITPEGPLKQRLVHQLYASSSFPQVIANLLLLSEGCMLERDIMIWNNKRYIKNPVLVKEDKLISRHRRWYWQFYSENSPTLQQVRESSIDW